MDADNHCGGVPCAHDAVGDNGGGGRVPVGSSLLAAVRGGSASYVACEPGGKAVDRESVRKVRELAEQDSSRSITFLSCHDPGLCMKFATTFYEGSLVVGPNNITSERLWNVGYNSTPFLDGLMQLSAIKTAVSSSGSDVVVAYSVWDCFKGKPDYMDSIASMWRFLYKSIRESGIGKIVFMQLVDGTRGSDKGQRDYFKFYSDVMSTIKTHWRRNAVIMDGELIKQINQITNQ